MHSECTSRRALMLITFDQLFQQELLSKQNSNLDTHCDTKYVTWLILTHVKSRVIIVIVTCDTKKGSPTRLVTKGSHNGYCHVTVTTWSDGICYTAFHELIIVGSLIGHFSVTRWGYISYVTVTSYLYCCLLIMNCRKHHLSCLLKYY